MIYDTKRFRDIIDRLDVTPNQMMICILLMSESKKRAINIVDYVKKHGAFSSNDFDHLINKGYLVDFNSPNVKKTIGGTNKTDEEKMLTSIVELYMVTPKFKEGIFIDDEDAAKEAWDAYPKSLIIEGKPQTTRTIEYESFVELYGKKINGNGILHKRVIEAFSNYKRLVKAGKVHGLGIKKAIETNHWEFIEEVMEDEKENTFGKEK